MLSIQNITQQENNNIKNPTRLKLFNFFILCDLNNMTLIHHILLVKSSFEFLFFCMFMLTADNQANSPNLILFWYHLKH